MARARIARWLSLILLGVAEVACLGALSLRPAAAQVLDERFPFLENRQRRNQQQRQQDWGGQQQQYSPWGYQEQQQQQRQAPAESARAPAPRKPDVAPTTNIVVFGDSLSEWLAYGLEEAFAETPEIGVTRKPRGNAGLIRVEQRGESYDWPSAAREILNAEKPDFIVIMLGLADRRGIRELVKQPAAPARTPAGQKQAATPPPADKPAKPADNEAPPEQAAPAAQENADDQQPQIMAPETATAGTVVHEFRSEKWGELYARRVDEMIGVLKAKGVPVLWVGLPSVRGTRATSEMVYLNDLYRGRAEKAGITYVDVWDGFVDDNGNYSNYGPDFEGQTRRLRSGDGAHFTRAGARKLAHYVEREIRRVLLAKASPVATPAPEPEPEAKAPPTAAAPGLPPRPVASPVMSLTAPKGAGDQLLGAQPLRNTPSDSVATRVLVKGEAIEAPAGRADDYVWPRRDIVTATGVLPPDPVAPPEPTVAAAAPAGTPAAAPAVTAERPKAPRPPREPREPRQADNGGWRPWGQPWGQQRYEDRQRQQNQGFFGGWFGGSRW
jgi:hypothetical protein